MTSWTSAQGVDSGLVATIFSAGNILDSIQHIVTATPPAYAQLTLASAHDKWKLARVFCPSGDSSCKVAQIAGWQAGRLLDDEAAMKDISDEEKRATKAGEKMNELIISDADFLSMQTTSKFFKPLKENILAAAYGMKNKDHTATFFSCWCHCGRAHIDSRPSSFLPSSSRPFPFQRGRVLYLVSSCYTSASLPKVALFNSFGTRLIGPRKNLTSFGRKALLLSFAAVSMSITTTVRLALTWPQIHPPSSSAQNIKTSAEPHSSLLKLRNG